MAMKVLPKVVVLTGAGISAESGIRTFRAADGLWENHRIEEVASLEAFAANPELVYRFYNERRAQLHRPEIRPNAAHLALAEWERKLGGNLLIVTQNVDNLHERAGSQNVIHMHGELLKARCTHSGQVYEWERDLDGMHQCSCCSPSCPLRPHIVWFGEMPLDMERIFTAVAECDYFIAIGTSGNVYPAAGLVREAPPHARTLEWNLEPSKVRSDFKEVRYGQAAQIVPQGIADLLAAWEK
ncbi:MAG: NAD-dependent protein deacylase [Neisseria sp.]|nr:NAD-dependent protein deacylase [Neisseria sp.]